jgi:hypothetical protein
MDYPEYAKVEDRLYKINTDFRIAIKCENVVNDTTITDEERAMAIIYLLFGEKGLKSNDKLALLDKAKNYLSCGKEIKQSNIATKPDMDFEEDMDYIEASFMSDYHIDLSNTKMHWWKFNKLINGLSNSDMGNCCILNRIRNIRNYNLKEISDPKERQRIKKMQDELALKKYKPKGPTEEQKKNAIEFYNALKK